MEHDFVADQLQGDTRFRSLMIVTAGKRFLDYCRVAPNLGGSWNYCIVRRVH